MTFPAIILALILSGCTEDKNVTDAETEIPASEYPFRISSLVIETEKKAPIVGKDKADYVNCTVVIDSENDEWDNEVTGRIRGRGNSTWLWYPKKPYRIKLDEKSEILGIGAEKDWVLLANYRDPTHLMNTFGFALGELTGLPFTNNSRYVEVTLNGDYIGLYQLTEQVEQGKNRVEIDDDEGLLISLDADDGPALNPAGTDNFWSSIYKMPVCLKYPEDAPASTLQAVKEEFALLEKAIFDRNYDTTAKLLNIKTLIDYLIIQEVVYNVEVAAPRSIFMFKDKNGLWTMGPLWDFDAGFDFDWNTMYTGHNYFANYKELVLGTDPAAHKGGYQVPSFFTDLFYNSRFVSEYKQRWSEIKDHIMSDSWAKAEKYADNLQEPMRRNAIRWPIDKDYETELVNMKKYLENRVLYLNTIITNYPAGN
ncbi:MAG: CotH kinase family protein [Dysgonamonadaceae bacterium]|nr:CotH kinase family protein [Dysgonamonadaceae bacterium]